MSATDRHDGLLSAIVAMSKWIDAHPANVNRSPEAQAWGRISKIAEENGEVIAAYIGVTGQNPRKGVTHKMSDVLDELLDVAITALGAYEHLTDNAGMSMISLSLKADKIVNRAGIIVKMIHTDRGYPEPREGFHYIFDELQHRWVPVCDVCGDEAAYCDWKRHKA
jgi:hypothetical protein